MPDPTISALPTAPSRADAPSLFVSRADAFVAALALFRTEVNAIVTWIAAAVATTSANLAAQLALLASAGFSGTSISSNTIGIGAKTFTIQTNRSFVVGSPVKVSVTASPSANYMNGVVTAYDIGTGVLSVAVSDTLGAGTFAAWTVSLSGTRGATGPAVLQAYLDTNTVNIALAPGNRYRLIARITAGTLPASPGVGGDPIEIMTSTDASTNYHTFTPDGAETVTVAGVAGSPLYFDAAQGEIIKLVPIAGGWELGN